MIFMITPTHRRPSQKADLVRLSQTLLAIPGWNFNFYNLQTNLELIF